MKKKETKGLFKGLFLIKPHAGCCNVQFEDVDMEDDTPEILSNKEHENMGKGDENDSKQVKE